jgi:hypothetical protein
VFSAKQTKKFSDDRFKFKDFSVNILKQHDHGTDYQERFENLIEQIFGVLYKHLTDNEQIHVFFEDYALSMVRNTTISVIELTGLIKMRIWKEKDRFSFSADNLIMPNSLKKLIGGKGNLKKNEIYDCAWNRKELQELLSFIEDSGYKYKGGCWQEDALDSWAVCEFGKIKSGLVGESHE